MINGKKVKFFEGFEFDNWRQAIGAAIMIIGICIGLLPLMMIVANS